MGASEVRLFHEHVLVKEPSADVATPWHQDAPYYCVEGQKTCSLWIPLDEVPRERTLEFVGGSHQWGKTFRPERFNKTALNENDQREAVPDIEGNRAASTSSAGRCRPATRWRSTTRRCTALPPIRQRRRAAAHFRYAWLVKARPSSASPAKSPRLR